MNEETIGSALTARRGRLGLDKGSAAKRIGMSRTTYSAYELDMQRPSAEVLPALASFLDVGMDRVFELYGASAIKALKASLEKSATENDVEVEPLGTSQADEQDTADSIGQSNTSSWRCAHGKTKRLDDRSYWKARAAGSRSPGSATRTSSGVLGGDCSRVKDRGRSG